MNNKQLEKIIISKNILESFKKNIKYPYDDEDENLSMYLEVCCVNVLTQYMELKKEKLSQDVVDEWFNDSRYKLAVFALASTLHQNPDILLTIQSGSKIDENNMYRILGDLTSYYKFNDFDKVHNFCKDDEIPEGELNFIFPLIQNGLDVSIDTSKIAMKDDLNNFTPSSAFGDLENRVDELNNLIGEKQDKLIAGANIEILGSSISAKQKIYNGVGLINVDNSTNQISIDDSDIVNVNELKNLEGEVNNNKILITKNQNDISTINSKLPNLALKNDYDNLVLEVEKNKNELNNKTDNSLFNSKINTLTNDVVNLKNNKQDTLIAGANITIKDNVISSSGGGSGGNINLDNYYNKNEIDTKNDELKNKDTQLQSQIDNNTLINTTQTQKLNELEKNINELIEKEKDNLNFVGLIDDSKTYNQNDFGLKNDGTFYFYNNSKWEPLEKNLINVDLTDFFTKQEINNLLLNKVDISNYTNDKTILGERLTKIETKNQEQDNLINQKLDATSLDNYFNKDEINELQKQQDNLINKNINDILINKEKIENNINDLISLRQELEAKNETQDNLINENKINLENKQDKLDNNTLTIKPKDVDFGDEIKVRKYSNNEIIFEGMEKVAFISKDNNRVEFKNNLKEIKSSNVSISTFDYNGKEYSAFKIVQNDKNLLQFEVNIDDKVARLNAPGANEFKIENLVTPTEGHQAANKEYVDSKISGVIFYEGESKFFKTKSLAEKFVAKYNLILGQDFEFTTSARMIRIGNNGNTGGLEYIEINNIKRSDTNSADGTIQIQSRGIWANSQKVAFLQEMSSSGFVSHSSRNDSTNVFDWDPDPTKSSNQNLSNEDSEYTYTLNHTHSLGVDNPTPFNPLYIERCEIVFLREVRR